ncbi:MAG: Glycosyl transferase group 1 [candidate division WS6 bacterium 34_10]|uniref:Glycosyl transferase group 1 n=1 Tax=candidate division WS6 bacterium 34_10 TaxID=1641389 RepID=A0A101HJ42_9BACT|nr:MAG: Glycosyl transferase group 1 [candidate division WS6 bacterium 34_10]
MQKEKILIIATTFPRWENDKIPNFVYELSREYTKKYDVHVLAPHSKGSKAYENMEDIKVHRFRYFFPKFENLSQGISISNAIERNKLNIFLIPFFLFSGLCKLLYLLIKYPFKIIHNHWLIPFSPFSAFFKPLFKYRLIVTSHGGDILGFSKGIKRYIIKKISEYAITKSDYYTVVSKEIKTVAEENFDIDFNNKLKVISMGIPYDDFQKVKPNFSKDSFTAVFVGRLSEMKGTEYLIRAIGELKKQGEKIKCKIIGDGPKREYLESLVKELNIEDQVQFTGFIPHSQLTEALNRTSVFVGPSITTSTGYKEGFGLVFIEAMAAGLPVIASRSGGITDTVKHKETGLLVEEKGYKQIAEYIKEIRDNESLRNELIKGGKQTAKQYSWQNIGERFMELF